MNGSALSGGTEVDTDVVIVGCGPVGLTAAILLAQHGWRVVAIDRYRDPYPFPRVVHFDGETSRLFAAAGIGSSLPRICDSTDDYEIRNGAGQTLLRYEAPNVPAELGWPQSANLAWKLDLVLGGRASQALLDTYQEERQPHVQHMMKVSIAMGRSSPRPIRSRPPQRDAVMLDKSVDPDAVMLRMYFPIGAGLVRPGPDGTVAPTPSAIMTTGLRVLPASSPRGRSSPLIYESSSLSSASDRFSSYHGCARFGWSCRWSAVSRGGRRREPGPRAIRSPCRWPTVRRHHSVTPARHGGVCFSGREAAKVPVHGGRRTRGCASRVSRTQHRPGALQDSMRRRW